MKKNHPSDIILSNAIYRYRDTHTYIIINNDPRLRFRKKIHSFRENNTKKKLATKNSTFKTFQ